MVIVVGGAYIVAERTVVLGSQEDTAVAFKFWFELKVLKRKTAKLLTSEERLDLYSFYYGFKVLCAILRFSLLDFKVDVCFLNKWWLRLFMYIVAV